MIPVRAQHMATLSFVVPLIALAGDPDGDIGRSSGAFLASPPLTVGTSLACIAANVGKVEVTLDIQLHDVNGTPVAAERCTLPPGAVNAGGSQCSVVEAAPGGFVGYCTFTVLRGSRHDIRAAILSQNANAGPGAQPSALAAE